MIIFKSVYFFSCAIAFLYPFYRIRESDFDHPDKEQYIATSIFIAFVPILNTVCGINLIIKIIKKLKKS